MDCGPAALKSILEGFGVSVSYGRLREACQTDVGWHLDQHPGRYCHPAWTARRASNVACGSSFIARSGCSPGDRATRLPNGFTHFLVIWNCFGRFLQVMDPGTGRRWPTWERFRNELYIHQFPVSTEAWRTWAGSQGMLMPLRRRMSDLGVKEPIIDRLVNEAVSDPGWRPVATLTLAMCMMASIVRGQAASPLVMRSLACSSVSIKLISKGM